ncbi:MAG: UDP-N-acetylmuramate dehydrogenase [Clostridia bacterium]|nr:UDP-N-acetylmuramate dehydrogenase [Clostridia bacterium]
MESVFVDEVKAIVGEDRLLLDEPMKLHTTFRIGGNADYFVKPESIEEIKALTECAKRHGIAYYVLGNGSNMLISDEGYRGMIIRLGEEFSDITMQDNDMISVQAGAKLSRIGNEAAAKGLTGFEFASGIPGTVGGAVVMNAGAYGGEIKDIIVSATVLTQEGNVVTLSNDELELGYRTSIIQKKGYIVLLAVFKLEKGDEAQIRSRMKELAEKRREKQPLEYPSAGSTFKRPEGFFAGKLIADAGLKGFKVGGAQVSEKHAGFVINTGSATACDVIELTDEVKRKIKQIYGVELELEVKKI